MKEIQKCDEIYISEDYDMFSLIEANRVIRQSHVAKLMQSMKNKNLLNPIIVNENHQIIDGQHRYTAWKNLGMPIKYIIGEGYGFSEVTTLNENQRNLLWAKCSSPFLDDRRGYSCHDDRRMWSR